MNRHIRSNSDFDPNMFLILLLILSAYSEKPIMPYKKSKKQDCFTEKELPKNQHNIVKVDNKTVKETNTINKVNVLSENNVLQKIADSNSNIYISNTDEEHNTNKVGENNYKFGPEDNLEKEAIPNAANKDGFKDITKNKIQKEDTMDMESEVNNKLQTHNIPEYPCQLIMPEAGTNPMLISAPVVVSQFSIELKSNAVVKLDCPASYIKRVSSSTIFDNCKLIPVINKLFISGVIRESIEYSSLKDDSKDSGQNIRHITVDIPFKGTTTIPYITPPVINSNEQLLEIEAEEHASSQYFNEKVCCKLVSAEINVIDSNESTLYGLEELKEVIAAKLIIKLTQNQDIKL